MGLATLLAATLMRITIRIAGPTRGYCTIALLPEVRPNSHLFGATEAGLFGAPIPVAGIAGDRQAAIFGQACFDPGMVKNTYGTGLSLLMNTGHKPAASRARFLQHHAYLWGELRQQDHAGYLNRTDRRKADGRKPVMHEPSSRRDCVPAFRASQGWQGSSTWWLVYPPRLACGGGARAGALGCAPPRAAR